MAADSAKKFSALIIGSGETLAEAIRAAGIGRYISAVSGVPEGSDALRALTLHPSDILVLHELPDEKTITELYRLCTAIVVCGSTEQKKACITQGVFFAEASELKELLPAVISSCVRMRELKGQTENLLAKLDDAKLINRAKLLLISRLNMTEAQAHRYIERTAMDNCVKIRELAERIIRTYEQ